MAFDLGGLGSLFGGGGGGGMGMGGILPMLASGQSMGILPMLMGQGGGQGGQQQQEQQMGAQAPSQFLHMQPRQAAFMGGARQPSLADLLQGRLGYGG